MAASLNDLKDWFARAEAGGAACMVVCSDTWDHEDYPINCADADAARKAVNEPGDMQRVMEVYDIALGWDAQKTGRVWNLPA